MFVDEQNTERVERQKAAEIMVVIGNPPYNVGQENENDNNKNRKYPVIDGRINADLCEGLEGDELEHQLSDAYVKFFRWATDRLQGRDGIVCFVSNNSFVDQIAFDGMRKHLLQDFTQIYHLDLHGNVRQEIPSSQARPTTSSAFRLASASPLRFVRASMSTMSLLLHRVPDDWRKEQKAAHIFGPCQARMGSSIGSRVAADERT